MVLPTLILGLILDQPSAPALLDQLGSLRYNQREAAQQALLDLGPAALPDLAAARHHPDPEIRTRAADITLKIEARRILETTLLEPGARYPTVATLLDDLAQRAQRPVRLANPATRFRVAPLALTVPAEGLTFWQAIALVENRHQLWALSLADEPEESLYPGDQLSLVRVRPGHTPLVDTRGPFRVRLQSADLHRSRNFEPVPEADEIPDQGQFFNLQLQVQAEPRLTILQTGPARPLVARDDAGNSLLPPAEPVEELETEEDDFLFIEECSTSLTTSLRLHFPEVPGRRIAELRGIQPLLVLQRRPDPAQIPLADSVGRVLNSGSWAVTINAFQPVPVDGQVTLDLEVTSDPGIAGQPAGDEPQLPLALLLERQLEILDSQGRALTAIPVEIEGDPPQHKVRLAIIPVDASRKPAQLRLHDLIRASHDLEFRFADVPLP